MTKENKIDDYLSNTDWRVNENANNGGASFSGLMLYLSTTEIAKYALEYIYPKEISDAHKNADIHIHDLGFSFVPYCMGHSLGNLIKEGINGIPGKASSDPAKHLSSLMIQMVNFLGCLQMEAAGAQAFNSVDTHLAPFVKKDNLSFSEVKQYMQQLVFNLNIPSRWGSQAPFTNFTFDLKCPNDMFNKKAIVSGIEQDFTYGDCQKEMDMINLAFMEVMEEGDSDGQIHTFPIPTYNIDKDFDWDSPITNKLCAMTAKYGVPYFANYVNSDMKAEDVRSMCPLDKNTLIAYRIKGMKTVFHTKIKEIFLKGIEIEVWTNEGWRSAKPIKMPATKTYTIIFDNTSVTFGENHLQPVLEKGTILAKDIKVNDWLPFSKKAFRNKDLGIYEYRQVKEIIEKEADHELYCFEVDSKDKLFMLYNGLFTHNCRLRLDLASLRKRQGGFFGASDGTGSLQVTTINLPRIGYLATSKDDLFQRLSKMCDLAKETTDIKRKVCNKTLKSGMIPFTKRYFKDGFVNHFSTIGIVGMNELLENFMNVNIADKEGNKLANEILDFINAKLSKYQEDSPDQILYNLEATPAEGTSYRFAKHDREKYPDIKTAGNSETAYYTNSVHLPVNYTDDIFKMLELEDEMQTKFTSGTVIHLYVGEQIENINVVKQLIKNIVNNYRLPYFSVTPTFSTCPDHGYIKGEEENCPKCNKSTQIWSRVTGYIRPRDSYNNGKKQEFKDRKYYKIEDATYD